VQILIIIYVVLFGMALGSFIGLAVVRIPRGESIVAPRSHCRNCQYVLKWYENIPILSYLLLLGKCRNCHEKISILYPILELLTTAITILAFINLQPWPRFFLYVLFFITPMLILALIDWEWLLLPDVLTLPGIAMGFLVHWIDGRFFLVHPLLGVSSMKLLSESLWGALAGSLTLFLLAWAYQKIRGREGLGGGDVKLAAMIGAFFGWKDIFFIFFLASIIGIIFGLILILARGHSKETPLPFGTCLAFTAILHLFYGHTLLKYYLGLLNKLI
jgi:leader peptidase (prepilin peptidase) / N-methyltransferase